MARQEWLRENEFQSLTVLATARDGKNLTSSILRTAKAKAKAKSDLSFLFTEWSTMFQSCRLGWKKTSVFITQNEVVLINIYFFKEKIQYRFGSVWKTTPRKTFRLPTKSTSVGKICAAYRPLDVGGGSGAVGGWSA
jgi:hypothetical protein